ncbi:hypothetical protein ACHAWF_014048 [Thalassiosira exigua]
MPRGLRTRGKGEPPELDVGGTGFVAAASTLTSNSTYFDALLSANGRSNDDGNLFDKLLGYMRRGMIKTEDVDADLLALVEFLGVERLLVAVKVRSYQNIGLGPYMSEATAEEVAAAFDRVHGGILQAVSSGSLPNSLLHTTHPKKDISSECFSLSIQENMEVWVTEFEFLRGQLNTVTTTSRLKKHS